VTGYISFNKTWVTIDNNSWSSWYLFTGNGSFPFNYHDAVGNTWTNTATVTWIDKTPVTGIISYDITWATNQNVTATISINKTWVIASGGNTHLFTNTGSFTFTFQDTYGNTWSTTATVTWIDKIAPTAPTITNSNYTTSGTTANPIVGSGEAGTTVKLYNNGTLVLWWWITVNSSWSYTITNVTNCLVLTEWTNTFSTTLTDAAGNVSGTWNTLTVTKDTTPPTVPTTWIIYTPSSLTSGNVTVTITGFSEGITGLNATWYTFTWNNSFTFTFSDLVGNTWTATATVTWIDKTVPVITLNGTSTGTIERNSTYTELGAVWSDNGSTWTVSIISGTVNVSVAWTYTLTYYYSDWVNTWSATRTRTVVDTTPPTATVNYSPATATSGSVVATLTGFSENITGQVPANITFTGNGTWSFVFYDLVGNTW